MTAADSKPTKSHKHLDAGMVFFESRRKRCRGMFATVNSVKYVNECFELQCAKDQIPNDGGICVFFNNIFWALGGGGRTSCSGHASKYKRFMNLLNCTLKLSWLKVRVRRTGDFPQNSLCCFLSCHCFIMRNIQNTAMMS